MALDKKVLLYGLVGFLVGAILASAVWFLYISKAGDKINRINSFEECAEAGYPILQTYPSICKTPDGRTFVEETEEREWGEEPPALETCQDLCGDGVCQEIVCMAIGCPCPETPETCPEDCQ